MQVYINLRMEDEKSVSDVVMLNLYIHACKQRKFQAFNVQEKKSSTTFEFQKEKYQSWVWWINIQTSANASVGTFWFIPPLIDIFLSGTKCGARFYYSHQYVKLSIYSTFLSKSLSILAYTELTYTVPFLYCWCTALLKSSTIGIVLSCRTFNTWGLEAL